MEYLWELISVSLVAALIGHFCPMMPQGLRGVLETVVSLVLCISLVLPVTSYIRSDQGVLLPATLLPDEDGAEVGVEYLELLKNETEKRLRDSESKEICTRFGFDEGEVRGDFSGSVKDGVYTLERVSLRIFTLEALTVRDGMVEYLEDKYLCGVESYEEII